MEKRKKILIEPRFQMRLLTRLAGWVTLSTVITAVVVVVFLTKSDQASSGDFFFVVRKVGAHPMLFSRAQIVMPALLVSLAINLVLSLTFALFYSRKLAGPVYRLTQDLHKLARGEKLAAPFKLREGDELQEVAHAFDTLISSLEKRKAAGGQ